MALARARAGTNGVALARAGAVSSWVADDQGWGQGLQTKEEG